MSNNNSNSFHPPPPPPPVPGADSGRLPPPPPPPPPSLSRPNMSTNPILSPLPPPPLPASARIPTTTTPMKNKNRNSGMDESDYDDAKIASGVGTKLPHSVHSAMPSLVSAPTSANISFDDIASKLMTSAASNSTEILQGAVEFFNAATGDSARDGNNAYWSQPTTVSGIPPPSSPTRSFPPPPPPPPSLRPATTGSYTSSTTNPFSATVVPLPPLPPPPQIGSATKERPGSTLSPLSAATSAETEVYGPPRPSTSLPYTQFRPKEPQPLSASQTSIPVLIIATESAHRMAWKNGLYISDMFEGLAQKNLINVSSGGQSSTATLPPFRSATRSLTMLTWDDLASITFTEPELIASAASLCTADQAAFKLQNAVVLQESDGNLQHELAVLEDQIDNLLYDDSNSGGYGFEDGDDDNYGDEQARDQNTGSSSDLMSKYQRIQRRQEQAYKDAYQLTSPMNIPWLWRYRLALDESTTVGGQQHEMFSCPAVILTICTTAEEMNPFETLSMLQNQQFYLPPLYYKNGLFDPTAVRHEVLVLHDNVQGPKNWDESALRSSLQRKYGPCASVVRINSIPPETAQQLASEETSDLWGGGGKLGNCLSVGDRATIRKYLTQFVQAAILPALERRIADLNTIVSDRKKGVKNVLKSLWGGGRQAASSNRLTKDSGVDNDDYNNSSAPTSGSGATATTSGTILYRYDSIESQTRLLGDTLFLMKDYDAALSMYRLIKEDFKQDNAWTHYGSIQEIIAMCLYYIDPYRNAKEIFANIESALLSYNRAASDEIKQQQMDGDFSSTNTSVGPGERAKYATLSTRLATRLCLVLASVRNISTGRNLEVADLLASASSGETSLGAAVLLEQSSAHYYKTEMFRKYAFHMLMSGHMFRSAMSADHHAFRCFTSALHIYNGSGNDGKWEELQNHLRSSLASLLFSMGRMAVALQLYAKLLGTTNGGRVSVKSQQKFISNLLEICNDHRKKALAGVDRMAASSSKYISAEERDRVRKAHLDRIVQVIQYTKSASRVLEIPNMDLPLVHDSTVSVIAEEEVHNQQDDNTVKPHFGEARVGSSEVWDDLMLWTLAELKAAKAGAKENISIGITTSDEVAPTIQKALQKIEDDDIRRVVMLVEKEKANRAMAERTRRRGKITQSPPVRAQMEPIAVEFDVSNPLGIPIDVNDLQLVAKMTTTAPEQHLQRLCTNEDPVFIKPLASFNERKKWKFQNSTVQYEVADFCRVSSSASIKSGDTKKESWKSADDTDPFFVVTKSNYTIQQECKMRISVSICPLVQGNLEILGIRYRLLDNVWVYHPFDIKGPLLQNTRSNRANRIRGESFLLKSKVERGMPCISVDVIPRVTRATPPCSESSRNDNGPVLQGEIGKWTLRVSNVGTAPASRISLKTNVPWITIDDCNHEISTPGDVTANERNATSYCVGPTGTLLHLPIDVFGKDNLKVLHEIQPGETIDIPVGIRTSGGVAGKQDLYMLFRYELPISEEGNQMGHSQQTSRFRWFKKMFEVPVYPSLSLSASIMPAFSSAHGEHILTLELTNGRIDRPDKPDIMLNTIALASRHYKLEAIPGQLASSGDNKSGFQLRWQERANIHYRIVLKERATSQQLLSECALSTIQQEEKSADKSMISSSLLGFICLERAHSSFEEALGIYQMALSRAAAQSDDGNPRTIAEIRRANTPGDIGTSSFGYDASDNLLQASTTVHTTSIERLCPADGFNTQLIQIFCTWSDVDQLIVGEHHIRDFPIIKPFASGTKHGCPITVSADHPTVISNDFTIGPAVIPLHVTLRNRLAEGVASNAIQVEFSVEQPDNFDFVSYPQDGYRRTLRGGEELSIPLKAMLPYAGVYNVQKLRLTTVESGATSSFGEPQPIVYHFPQQWMVTARSI